MIRKATANDIDKISAIFSHIHNEEEAGRTTTGWIRDVYPIRQTAVDALERDDLFVEEDDDTIVAAGIINQIQPPAYADCDWEHDVKDDIVMVLHTLVVDPKATGRGYGKAFVQFYEKYALEHGCPYLRIDTNERNTTARKMYAKLGFRESGIVSCIFNGIPDVHLVCLEKKLEESVL